MRTPDADIPENEKLYRRAEPGHVTAAGVSTAAVELPRCSFNRSEYSSPRDVIRKPTHTAVVSVTPGSLPKDPVPRADGAAAYVFFAADDPNPQEDPANDAHCEVRIRRSDMAFSTNHKPPKPVIAQARGALARKMLPVPLTEEEVDGTPAAEAALTAPGGTTDPA